MKHLVLLLAATALVPGAAMAQQRVAPQPGVSWANPAARPVVRPAPIRSAAPPPARAERMVARQGGGESVMRHGPRRHYRDYRRVDRGHVLPQTWWGPRHHIQQWSAYGLPAPVHGGRWVRYYDDALMIDGGGRVRDGRWGMAWDEWDDQWSYDRGVPEYVGEGDFYPGGEDYAWVEGGGRYAGPHHPLPPGGDCGPCDGQQVYHHGGYGYGYGGGMVVTETTVTTSPTVIVETVYEEEVVKHRVHRPKHYRSKKVRSKLRHLPRG